jgi:hypothetical protein
MTENDAKRLDIEDQLDEEHSAIENAKWAKLLRTSTYSMNAFKLPEQQFH